MDRDASTLCDYAVAVCQGILAAVMLNCICSKFIWFSKCVSEPFTSAGNCSYGDVRLVNGSSPLEGRVEICINNAWGSVCTHTISEDDVQVICRQVGQLPPSKLFRLPK